jgi:hypothetical protein
MSDISYQISAIRKLEDATSDLRPATGKRYLADASGEC